MKRRRFFDSSRVEKEAERNLDRKREAEKLRELLGEIAKILRNQQIPVDDECRVDMKSFSIIYGDPRIDLDIQRVRESKKGRNANNLEDRLLTDGERLEVLKTIIFHKFLGEKFFVVRSSVYDDLTNNVDNLIVEKETGNIVCAFDEVSSFGKDYEKKQNKVLYINLRGGARLKYGFISDGSLLILQGIKNIPIFYLSLSPEFIDKGIKKLSSNLNEISDFERKLIEYFLKILLNQIQQLKLIKSLNQTLAQRIESFRQYLENKSWKISEGVL